MAVPPEVALAIEAVLADTATEITHSIIGKARRRYGSVAVDKWFAEVFGKGASKKLAEDAQHDDLIKVTLATTRSQPVVTIEKTSKKWKELNIAAGFMILFGFLGSMPLLAIGGFVLGVYAWMGSWWEHS